MSHDIEKVKAIITQSGNSFHCKVLKFLKEKGWSVLISPYYNDNISNKPREIDLVAEKAFATKDEWGDFKGNIHVRLFVECKYISQKTVFWFHDKDELKALELVTQTTPLTKGNFYTKDHHYLNGNVSVAKLFADEKKSAADNEVFYKALNQSLNAMVYYRNKESIISSRSGREGQILATVNYPVIVCNSFDNLYRVDIDGDADPCKIGDNFQLEVNYAYTTSSGYNTNEYFLIDVLSFDLLDPFLDKIEVDKKTINLFLNP
jgi:hypothetical protein